MEAAAWYSSCHLKLENTPRVFSAWAACTTEESSIAGATNCRKGTPSAPGLAASTTTPRPTPNASTVSSGSRAPMANRLTHHERSCMTTLRA